MRNVGAIAVAAALLGSAASAQTVVDVQGVLPSGGGLSFEFEPLAGRTYEVRGTFSEEPTLTGGYYYTANYYDYAHVGGEFLDANDIYGGSPIPFSGRRFVAFDMKSKYVYDSSYTVLDYTYKSTSIWIDFGPGGPVTYDFSIAVVPEPSTWAVMILGIAAAGASLRRSAKQLLLRGAGQ